MKGASRTLAIVVILSAEAAKAYNEGVYIGVPVRGIVSKRARTREQAHHRRALRGSADWLNRLHSWRVEHAGECLHHRRKIDLQIDASPDLWHQPQSAPSRAPAPKSRRRVLRPAEPLSGLGMDAAAFVRTCLTEYRKAPYEQAQSTARVQGVRQTQRAAGRTARLRGDHGTGTAQVGPDRGRCRGVGDTMPVKPRSEEPRCDALIAALYGPAADQPGSGRRGRHDAEHAGRT